MPTCLNCNTVYLDGERHHCRVESRSVRHAVWKAVAKAAVSVVALNLVTWNAPRLALFGWVPVLGSAVLVVATTARERRDIRLLGHRYVATYFVAASLVTAVGVVAFWNVFWRA